MKQEVLWPYNIPEDRCEQYTSEANSIIFPTRAYQYYCHHNIVWRNFDTAFPILLHTLSWTLTQTNYQFESMSCQ